MANEKFLDLSTLQTGLERYDDSLADVAKSGDYDDLSNPPAFELPKTDEYISLEVTGSKYIAYNQQEDFNMLMNCMMECYDSDIKNRDAIVLKINDDEYTGTNTIEYSMATWTFLDANLKATLSNISRPIPEGALSIAVNPQIDFEMIDQSGDSTVYDAIQAGDIVQFPIPPIVYTAIVNTKKLNELQESISLGDLLDRCKIGFYTNVTTSTTFAYIDLFVGNDKYSVWYKFDDNTILLRKNEVTVKTFS